MTLDSSTVVAPRPAATVLVVRDAGSQLEVLLAQRSAYMRFMAGAHVFPGGAVHESDHSVLLAQRIALQALPWPQLPDPEADRAHALAAVRETLEEVGLLIAAGAIAPACLEQLRTDIRNDRDFGECLSSAGVALDLGQLVPLIRWITPRSEPLRFDTRFYVARAPDAQTPEPDARETAALIWRTPQQAIDEAALGALRLSAPTKRMLQEIASLATVDRLLAKARSGSAPTVEPVLMNLEGRRMIVFPGDPEHPVSTPALDGPTRAVF